MIVEKTSMVGTKDNEMKTTKLIIINTDRFVFVL